MQEWQRHNMGEFIANAYKVVWIIFLVLAILMIL